MNTRALPVALCAIALLATSAANAQSRYNYSVNGASVMTNMPAVVGTTNVMTYPAVVTGSTCAPSGVVGACDPLFGEQTHWDNDMEIRDNSRGLLGGLFGTRERLGVNTYSAVIPSELAPLPATRICGQQKANEMFSLRLFGFGLGFGKVNPDHDMRPAGHAL